MMRTFVHSVLFLLAWVLGFATTKLVFAEADAVGAYALLNGWWLACLLAAKLVISPKTMIPVGAVYLIAFTLVWLIGLDWLYHGLQGASPMSAIYIGIVQTLVFASPIIFSYLIDFLLRPAKLLER